MKHGLTHQIGFAVICASFLGAGRELDAAVIRVPADRPTIQQAIAAAVNGDLVQVAPGTYIENLNFMGKAIRVESEQGPEVTIIDGNQSGTVVTFASGETLQSVLHGFTVRNGKIAVPPYVGGGIYIKNASPTIDGNIISNNLAGGSGGGIHIIGGSPLIQGNVIRNNGQIPGWGGGGGGGIELGGPAQVLNNVISNNTWNSGTGGGIDIFGAGTPTIQNNVIANNSAYSEGGGIAIFNQSDVAIVQNIIIGNTAPTGGGVYWGVPSGSRGPFLINNTISGNVSPEGSGVFADGFDAQAMMLNNIVVAAPGQTAVMCGSFNDLNPPIFRSNDVYSASGAAYGGACTNQTGLNGNISADPLFVNAGATDFHLQYGSQAIDAGTAGGTPTTDFDSVTRPLDGNRDGVSVIDIGAYELMDFDHVPPVTVASATPAPGASGWNTTDVTVTLNATDDAGGSGVANIRYWLNGAHQSGVIVAGNPTSIRLTADGITTVNFSALDKAGNVEPSRSVDVAIDRTGPVIAGLPKQNKCGLIPSKHQMVQVAIVTASDPLSGVSSLAVTATSSEPDSGTSPDDLPGDILISGTTVQLRAERSPSGTGRIYTIIATAQDSAGNTTTMTTTCSVPN